MGVHDNYCCICGAPDNNSALDYISNMIDDNDDMLNQKDVDIKHFFNEFEILENELTWLNNLYLITSENKIIKPIKYNSDDSTYLDDQKNIYDSAQFTWESNDNPSNICIVCHVDCYNFLHEKLNYDLNFNHVCRRLDDRMSVFKNKNIYGTIAKKYSFRQDFKWFELLVKIKKNQMTINQDNVYFLLSPLKSDLNGERLLSIWSDLYNGFLNNGVRDSSSLSANLFNIKTVLKGNDNNDYVVNKKQQWILVKK